MAVMLIVKNAYPAAKLVTMEPNANPVKIPLLPDRVVNAYVLVNTSMMVHPIVAKVTII